MVFFAAPDWQRSAPVAIAGKRPVDIVIEPVTKSTILNRFWEPISFFVLG